jgi:hypothetical protein
MAEESRKKSPLILLLLNLTWHIIWPKGGVIQPGRKPDHSSIHPLLNPSGRIGNPWIGFFSREAGIGRLRERERESFKIMEDEMKKGWQLSLFKSSLSQAGASTCMRDGK